MDTFGSRISYLIEYLHTTQANLAKAIKVSQAYISQICADKRAPSERTISDICEKYQVSRDWLLNGKGDPFPKMTRAQEISAYADAMMADAPDSARSIIIAYIMSLDAEDWEAIVKIIKKHGFPGQAPIQEQEEPAP